jgi:iron uptake system component EfeO
MAAAVVAAGCSGTPATATPSAAGGSSAASPSAAPRTVRITMTDAACVPEPATISAGPVTFDVVNVDSSRSTEAELVQGDRILAEKEHLTPGLSGTFTLELTPGAYDIYCPGAQTERTPFTVTAGT